MPRRAKGAYLYLRPSHPDKRSGKTEPASWIIRDGQTVKRTGCREGELEEAERKLGEYIAAKHVVDRSPDRRAADIEVADVITIYSQDCAARQSRPKEIAARLGRVLDFFGRMALSEVNGRTCRAYAAHRGSAAAARRELEDLRSAVNHHRREGLCSEIVSVVLPDPSEPRERWLTRDEAARLIWQAYRYREVQKGQPTGRRSRRHIARFILVGLYTGTRAGAICSASFTAGRGRGFLDLDRGVFYRRRAGTKETKKRQPPVRLPDRLLVHLRRWHRLGISGHHVVEFNRKPVGKINKAFRNVVVDAGLGKEVTPHVLRHTAATWMMQNGVPLNQAADFLGMTMEILERVYKHAHPDFQQEAAAGIARRSTAKSPPTFPHTNKASDREQTSKIVKDCA